MAPCVEIDRSRATFSFRDSFPREAFGISLGLGRFLRAFPGFLDR